MLLHFGRRAFNYLAPSVWNDLPLAVRSLLTKATFRSQLKTYLITQSEYSAILP